MLAGLGVLPMAACVVLLHILRTGRIGDHKLRHMRRGASSRAILRSTGANRSVVVGRGRFSLPDRKIRKCSQPTVRIELTTSRLQGGGTASVLSGQRVAAEGRRRPDP